MSLYKSWPNVDTPTMEHIARRCCPSLALADNVDSQSHIWHAYRSAVRGNNTDMHVVRFVREMDIAEELSVKWDARKFASIKRALQVDYNKPEAKPEPGDKLRILHVCEANAEHAVWGIFSRLTTREPDVSFVLSAMCEHRDTAIIHMHRLCAWSKNREFIMLGYKHTCDMSLNVRGSDFPRSNKEPSTQPT